MEKQNYEAQIKFLNDWIVAQKVFKDLAARLMAKKT
jgi:hypothetical protein